MEEIPRLPEEIKEAFENYQARPLCLFIGAGISRLAGCLSWRELCENILKDSRVQKAINYEHRMILLRETDNKVLLTKIFNLFLSKNNPPKDFYEILKNNLLPENGKPEIYKIIGSLKYALKVTTNADLIIDENLNVQKQNIFFDNFNSDQLAIPKNLKERPNLNKLFKVHGTIGDTNPSQLIFTTPNYLERYREPSFQRFLTELFTKFTVLFIGYGMSEFELLQYTLPNKDCNSPHILLKGYCLHQQIEVKIDTQYYKQLGIKLCEFYFDENGHSKLINILDNWVGYLNSTLNPHIIRERIKSENITLEEIGSLFITITNTQQYNKEEDVLREAYRHAPPKAYLTWLKYFDDNGYLKAEAFLKRGESEDEKGNKGFSNSLLFDFLIEIFQNSESSHKEEIKQIVLRFICEYVEYSSTINEWHNPYSDECIIRIICELDLNEITKKHINFLIIAFTNSPNLFHATEAIKSKLIPKLLKAPDSYLFDLFLEKFLLSEKLAGGMINYNLERLLETNLESILNKGSHKIIEICENRINALDKETLQEEKNTRDFWVFEVPKIRSELNYDDDSHFNGRFIIFMLQKALFKQDIGYLKIKISSYFKTPESIYARVAIFVINHKYKELKDLLWELPFNPFLNFSIRPELHDLLRKHQHLDEVELRRFFDWWKELDNEQWYEDSEQNEKIKNYQKQLRIALLREPTGAFCDQRLKSEYENLEKITKKKEFKYDELEGSHFSIKSGWVRDDITSEILNLDHKIQSKRSAKEIFEFIRDYEPTEEEKDNLNTPAHSAEGALEEAFRNDIKRNTKKYLTEEIYEFLKSENFKIEKKKGSWGFDRSQERCIEVFVSLLQSLNIIEIATEEQINNLLEFVHKILNTRKTDSQDYLIQYISQLAFSLCNKTHLGVIENLLIICANKTEDDKESTSMRSEPFNAYINAPRGKVLDNLMQFALQEKQINETKTLNQQVLNYFEKCLNTSFKSDDPHLWCCLGFFISTIYYLNPEWFNNNIDKILPLEEERESQWYSAFISYSYMVGNNGLNLDFSEILITRGDYKKALEYKSQNERDEFYRAIASQIILLSTQHSYLIDELIQKGYEQLFWNFIWQFNNLFPKLLMVDIPKGHESQIEEIRNAKKVEMQKKLKEIWKKCLERLGQQNSEKDLYRSLSRWVDLVDLIDNKFQELIEKTIKCWQSNDQYFDPFFLFDKFSQLSEISTEQAKYVGSIWINLLCIDGLRYPPRSTPKMKKTLENLQINSPVDAKEIKDIYERRWGNAL